MTPIVSTHAVFDLATGEIATLVPAAMLDDVLSPALGSVSLPAGYEDGLWRWDADAREMAIDLIALRARRWLLVKTARDRAEWWGCTTPLGRVDTDPDSQRKVSGATQMAMIAQAAGAPFAIDWTMQDNSAQLHDAAAMVTMGVLVGQHVAACHAVALGKREAIEAAGTAAEIEAVDVDDGWPDPPPA